MYSWFIWTILSSVFSSAVVLTALHWETYHTLSWLYLIIIVLTVLPAVKIPRKRSLIQFLTDQKRQRNFCQDRLFSSTVGIRISSVKNSENLFNPQLFAVCQKYMNRYGLTAANIHYEFFRSHAHDPWKLIVSYTYPIMENYSRFMMRNTKRPVSATLTAQMARLTNDLAHCGYSADFPGTKVTPTHEKMKFFVLKDKNIDLQKISSYTDLRIITIIAFPSSSPVFITGLAKKAKRHRNRPSQSKALPVKSLSGKTMPGENLTRKQEPEQQPKTGVPDLSPANNRPEKQRHGKQIPHDQDISVRQDIASQTMQVSSEENAEHADLNLDFYPMPRKNLKPTSVVLHFIS